MSDLMSSVWVVEVDCYNERYVAGVYSSIDAVKAAYPTPDRPVVNNSRATVEREGGWRESSPGYWSNGLDWADAVRAHLFVLDEGA